MKCPKCSADTRVLSTRNGDQRRRECFNEHRFTTIEVICDLPKPQEEEIPHAQVK